MTAHQRTLIDNAKELHEHIAATQDNRDAAIRAAYQSGLSLRQVAEGVGISHQRVAQIVAG